MTDPNTQTCDSIASVCNEVYNKCMKVPLLQKIEISIKDLPELEDIFRKNSIGSIPTILIFTEMTIEHTKKAIHACEALCRQKDLDPSLPYPLYILNQWQIEQSFFPEVSDLNNIPRHFVKKIKRVKKREQNILDKVVTLSNRINNHHVTGDLEYIALKAKDNKRLKELCSEKNFYLDLITKLGQEQEA